MKRYFPLLLVAALFACHQTNHQPQPTKLEVAGECRPDCVVSIEQCAGRTPAKVLKHKRSSYNQDVSELYEKLDKSMQSFKISPAADTSIMAQEGTTLKIAAGTFVYEDTGEPVQGDVQVSIKEYYSLADILLSELTTLTRDDKMLETGGMIYLDAVADGRKCKIKEGESVEISFNPADIREGMQLFSGVKNKRGEIEWDVMQRYLAGIEYTTGLDMRAAGDIPVYPGGFRKFIRHLAKEIKYDRRDFRNGVSGLVKVQFTIDRKGRLRETKIVQRDDKVLNNAVVDAVEKMPVWEQGRSGVTVTMPVSFGRNNAYTVSLHKIEMKPITIAENTDQLVRLDDGRYRSSTVASMSSYVFSTTSLGWINCDRFYQTTGEKTKFFVNAGLQDDADVKMVFHDMRSILTGYQEAKGSYAFENIPAGQKVTIVGFKYEGGKIQMGTMETVTGKEEAIDLSFVEMTEDALKAEMKKLNAIN